MSNSLEFQAVIENLELAEKRFEDDNKMGEDGLSCLYCNHRVPTHYNECPLARLRAGIAALKKLDTIEGEGAIEMECKSLDTATVGTLEITSSSDGKLAMIVKVSSHNRASIEVDGQEFFRQLRELFRATS